MRMLRKGASPGYRVEHRVGWVTVMRVDPDIASRAALATQLPLQPMLNCLPSPVLGTKAPKKGSSPSEDRPVVGAQVAVRVGGGGGGGGKGGAIQDTNPG